MNCLRGEMRFVVEGTGVAAKGGRKGKDLGD